MDEQEEGDGGGEKDEAVVLLPHCVVHPMVDLQVRIGKLRLETLGKFLFW